MTHVASLILATSLALSTTLPAHAGSGTSCNEFMSMDVAGQAAATSSMALPSDLSPLSDDSTAADALVAQVKLACETHPDMMVDEAMEMMDS